MVVAGQAQHGAAAGEGARQAQRQHGCFGARGGEAQALDAREQAHHQFGPAQFQVVFGAVVRAARHLFSNGGHNRRVGVAQQQRAVAGHVVDQLVAIDIPFVRARAAFNIQRKRRDKAAIVRDAVRENRAGAGVALSRPRVAALIFGFNRHGYSWLSCISAPHQCGACEISAAGALY